MQPYFVNAYMLTYTLCCSRILYLDRLRGRAGRPGRAGPPAHGAMMRVLRWAPALLALVLPTHRAGATHALDGAIAGDESDSGAADAREWDVAIGRRPYINETEGHLLLKVTAGPLLGQRLRVTAALCAGALGNWSWDLDGSTPVATSGRELAGQRILSLGSLTRLPERVNNDMVITLTCMSCPARNTSSIRRRFQRAYRSDMGNTVQVDHHTGGLRVDGAPWAGWGWYQYSYTSFVPPDCDPSKIDGHTASGLQKNYDCMRWGIANET
jgi:hypothetical protein